MDKKSNSVGNIQGIFAWLSENTSFFVMRLKGLKNSKKNMSSILHEIDYYASYYNSVTGLHLVDAKILEIGYGARPNRLLSMISLGYDAVGIDLDRPILNFGFNNLYQVYRGNGFKRAIKSLVRVFLFDRHERAALKHVLSKRGVKLNLDESKFLVGDASTFSFPPQSIDFIYSEDVFEHIPIIKLHTICKNISDSLSKNGLAIISPVIYSGISGGHLVDWYPHTLSTDTVRKTEPWEHLRKRKIQADCYLNELRVGEFKEIFSKYFEILEIINCNKGVGQEYLSKEIKNELSQYSEEELLSNKWMFVLKK